MFDGLGEGVSAPRRHRKVRVPVCILVTLWLLAALLVDPATSAAGGEWELVTRNSRLTVERRSYAGSALAELRGVTVVQASLSALMALLRDAPYNQQWVYRSGGAQILEAEGFSPIYVYGVVDAPLPLRDRDTVVRFDYHQDPDTRVITITITNHADFIPHKEGYVRVPDFGGHWRLLPLAGGRVEVTYQVYGDPGGWVPPWLGNYAAAVSVTRTLHNIHTAVRDYDGRVLGEVEELPVLVLSN